VTKPPLRFVDVGPRDGLQNEKIPVPLKVKVAYVERAAETGVGEVEAGSFVSPQAVPQMKDTDEVFGLLRRKKGVVYSALVPNEKGFERALAAKADKIAVFTAASETFNRKNIRASIAGSLGRFRPVVLRALQKSIPVRGYLSTAFHCPYEGPVAVEKVIEVCERLLDLGVEELSIGDTIGKASPDEVRALLEPLLEIVPAEKIFLHFHNTYGLAVANALTAWREFGISGYDASSGGLGGCPYAPGASGNVALEDLAYAFAAEGGETGLDIDKILAAIAWIEPVLGHPPDSHLGKMIPLREGSKRRRGKKGGKKVRDSDG